jgi:hypothetical protein
MLQERATNEFRERYVVANKYFDGLVECIRARGRHDMGEEVGYQQSDYLVTYIQGLDNSRWKCIAERIDGGLREHQLKPRCLNKAVLRSHIYNHAKYYYIIS